MTISRKPYRGIHRDFKGTMGNHSIFNTRCKVARTRITYRFKAINRTKWMNSWLSRRSRQSSDREVTRQWASSIQLVHRVQLLRAICRVRHLLHLRLDKALTHSSTQPWCGQVRHKARHHSTWSAAAKTCFSRSHTILRLKRTWLSLRSRIISSSNNATKVKLITICHLVQVAWVGAKISQASPRLRQILKSAASHNRILDERKK